jgi:hypothetical protein
MRRREQPSRGRVGALGGVLAALLALAGCDSGPSGPGFLAGSIIADGEAPRAALLLLSGRGILDVEGTHGTLGWVGALDEDEVEVLLVNPEPDGSITFRIRVEDVAARIPEMAVLQLSDRENRLLSGENVRIRVER